MKPIIIQSIILLLYAAAAWTFHWVCKKSRRPTQVEREYCIAMGADINFYVERGWKFKKIAVIMNIPLILFSLISIFIMLMLMANLYALGPVYSKYNNLIGIVWIVSAMVIIYNGMADKNGLITD